MKLISCYIENYGAIEKKEYFFEGEITAFCQENGYGKSTLASFIKAMFYGLKGYKDGSTEFCDREHFYPFNGGKFGGNLTFSKDGKTYKIERYFGEKTTRGDTLKVYCNGEVTEELGEDIGKTVFGVDEKSFLRTLFIGSEEIEIESTSSINAKLGSFLQGMDEEVGFDNALKKLDEARKNYQADRRSKNPTEMIPSLERELEEIRSDMDNAKTIQRGLEYKYTRAEQLKGEIEALNGKIVEAQEENERRKAFEHYDSLAQGIAEKEKRAQETLGRYPMGLPAEEETLAIKNTLAKRRERLAVAESIEFSPKDAERLARLEGCFSGGEPTEEDILKVRCDVEDYGKTQTEMRVIDEKAPTEREKLLLQKFLHGHPKDTEISEFSAEITTYKEKKKEQEETPFELVSQLPKQNVSKLFPLLTLLAGLCCFSSVVGFWRDNIILAISLLALGVAIIFSVVILAFKRIPKMVDVRGMAASNMEKQRKEMQLRDLEYGIKAKLTRYGYHSDNGVVYDFAQLQKDVEEYSQYIALEQERKERFGNLQAQLQAITNRLTAFFRAYGLSGEDYTALLSNLQSMIGEYRSLRERKVAYETRKKALDCELEEADLKIEAYKRKYGFTELCVEDILEDCRLYHRLCVEIEKEKTQAATYKEKEKLAEKPTGEREDLSLLQAQLTEKQNERSKLEREIQADEMEAEKVYDLETKLSDGEERLKEYKQRHKLLKAAKEFLELADGNLKDKYVKPIKDEFLRYAELLEKTLGERVVMTKNFEIRFERDGAERSEKHLSAGQRSICALCFRLALIKNMYKENLPFLVLDDPFVALDERHMDKVKALLKELSKEMQMVYFTCHESRIV